MRAKASASMRVPGRQFGLGVIVLLSAAGCHQAPYPTAPVRGTVKIDGQPMAGGKVMFAPVARGGLNSGRPAFATIHRDGSFVLSTYGDADGAVVGEHWVSIVNDQPAAGNSARHSQPQLALDVRQPVSKSNFQRIVFPRKVVSVLADEENLIDIAMTSEDIAKYGQRADADD